MSAEAQGRDSGKTYVTTAAAERNVGSNRDDFLALLSHELRTPLHSLVGWLQVLERDPEPEVRARAIAAMGRSARAMRQIVDDIGDQSRIRSGKLRLTLVPVDVPGLVRAVVEAARPTAQERGVHVEVQMPGVLPSIRADAGRLRQIVANLLSNALKFTPAGGRVVVEATADDGADAVRIVVSDTGRGIARSALPNLFTRFYQGEDVVAGAQGLGLGLPLVKELVERHGGTVRAESEGPGKGARFTVALPTM